MNRETQPPSSIQGTNKFDVIIIGGGPIGLLLANLLGRRGTKVLVAERRTHPVKGSMAIGITPPSLHILNGLELDREFTEQGVAITTAKVFERGLFLGDVDFSKLDAQHRYILSLPQSETIALLRDNLRKYPSVTFTDGMEFIGQSNEPDHVRVKLKDRNTATFTEMSASYLVGCDGSHSQVREQAGIGFPGGNYPSQFFMADFEDNTVLGPEAHLYFGPSGSVESFPLSGNRRRWIIQMPRRSHPDAMDIGATVAQQVLKRTGFDLTQLENQFESSFLPQRRLAKSFNEGRVLLCGDAAHVMSPIGGQGMNTGFADAAHLDRALATALESPETATSVFASYNQERRQSFRIAASRAARGMWLGTRTGILSSNLRKWVVQKILFRPVTRKKLAPYFAMLTIPGSPLAHKAPSQ